jgi:G3E family GTPase
VAPPRFEKLIKAFPNLESQIRTADTVLINKTDLATPEEIEQVRRKITQLAADVEVLETQYAGADLVFWREPVERPVRGELAVSPNPYASLTLVRGDGVDRERLRRTLDTLGEDLLRAKGWVASAEGRFFLDYASGETRWSPLGHGSPAPGEPVRLVVIVPEAREQEVLHKLEPLGLKQLVNLS